MATTVLGLVLSSHLCSLIRNIEKDTDEVHGKQCELSGILLKITEKVVRYQIHPV